MPEDATETDRNDRRRWPSRGLAALLSLVVLSGPLAAAAAPQRVVSINLCTDQLAMEVAGPGQLVSVSRLARDPALSNLADVAAALPVNDGRAEEIVPLSPDLVLAGQFTARATVALLRRLGWHVEGVAPAQSFADIRADLLRMGTLLGQPDRAAQLVAAFDARLATLGATASAGRRPTAVVYHIGDRAEGSGTLADQILVTAGWRNLAADLGILGNGPLPLEILVSSKPDLVLVGSAEASWSTAAHPNARHPALLAAVGGVDRLHVIPDRTTVCGTPAVVEAIEWLVEQRHRLAWDGKERQ